MTDDGLVGGAVCILDTEDIHSVIYRSRKPMKSFHSPFLGKTDDEIRSWVKENLTGLDEFAERTFTILDEDTIKNKTCRIGYVGGDDRMLIADFFANLPVRIPVEMSERSWCENDYLGTEKVFGRKYLQG